MVKFGFGVGDVVEITQDFKGDAREFLGQIGVLQESPFESFDFLLALGGNEEDLLAVNEEEIKHV